MTPYLFKALWAEKENRYVPEVGTVKIPLVASNPSPRLIARLSKVMGPLKFPQEFPVLVLTALKITLVSNT